jgi:hypothetical protein
VVTPAAVNGAIAPVDGSLVNMSMKDWAMNLPFLLINSVMAGMLGAAFNSLRMWLWKVGSKPLQSTLRVAMQQHHPGYSCR